MIQMLRDVLTDGDFLTSITVGLLLVVISQTICYGMYLEYTTDQKFIENGYEETLVVGGSTPVWRKVVCQ